MSTISVVPEYQFIERLKAQAQLGYGLVPFIGSGCSYQSGIMMGEGFSDYLAWTVFRCVAGEDDQGGQCRWDLREMGWPAQPSFEEVERARRWAFGRYKEVAGSCGLRIDDTAEARIRGVARLKGEFATPDAIAELLYAPLVPPFLRARNAISSALTEGSNLRRLHALLRGPGVLQGGLARPSFSPTSLDAIEERALRSLYDWRATLAFLSELKLDSRSRGRPLLLLDPDPTVIDRFTVHITQGRRPNFTHAMLCHLRLPARIRLMLTTNFDTLIEDAFTQQHRRIHVISVSAKGGLPDPEIVHARDSLVKLHGELNETRADFSLDDEPTLEDRVRFLGYVRGARLSDDRAGFVPANLLVAGYSGSDLRCVQMMKFVLDCDPQAQIFWVCHDVRGRERLQQTFPERAYRNRIVATVAERTDLLLFELYQRITLGFPSGNQSFQTNYLLPPEHSFRPSVVLTETPLDPAAQRIYDEMQPHVVGDVSDSLASPGEAPPGCILFVDGSSGVMRAIQAAGERLVRENGLSKAWFELEDYGDSGSLAHTLFQLIAIERGLLNLNHAELCPPDLQGVTSFTDEVSAWDDYIVRTSSHLGIEPRNWIITLYGRNGPGGCSGWEENDFWHSDEYGDDGRGSPFVSFLYALAMSGMRIIYAPYTEIRRRHDKDCIQRLGEIAAEYEHSPELAKKVSSEIDQAATIHFGKTPTTHDFGNAAKLIARYEASRDEERPVSLRSIDLSRYLPTKSLDSYTKSVEALLRIKLHLGEGPRNQSDPYQMDTPRARYNALYASSLFRQSRHYSAFFNEAVFRCPARYNPWGIDNDLLRDRRSQDWLLEFNQRPEIFFRKPGGFAWMYRDVRLSIRCLAEVMPNRAISDHAGDGVPASVLPGEAVRSRTHIHIGNWYFAAFRSSSHANSLMEAAYHFFQATKYAHRARRVDLSDSPHDLTTARYRMHIWQTATKELVRTLRTGGRSFQFWFSAAQANRWFSLERCQMVYETVDRAYRHDLAEARDTVRAGQERADAAVKTDPVAVAAAEEDLLALLQVELEQCRLKYHRSGQVRSMHSQRVFRYASIVGVVARVAAPTAQGTAENRRSPLIDEIMRRTRAFVEGNTSAIDKMHMGNFELEYLSVDPLVSSRNVEDLVNAAERFLAETKWTEHAQPITYSNDQGGSAKIRAHLRSILCPMEIRRKWVRVCIFARLAIDAAHRVFPGPDALLSRRLHKAYCLYGLALARLHRFREAHRRFNDAQVLAIEHREPERLLLDGRVDVRRAEALLIEAGVAREVSKIFENYCAAQRAVGWKSRQFDMDLRDLNVQRIGEWLVAEKGFGTDEYAGIQDLESIQVLADLKDVERRRALWLWLEPHVQAARDTRPTLVEPLFTTLSRYSVAQCDSAWRCLERAEFLFGGRSSSPRWWGRLRSLQLRAHATTGSSGKDDQRGSGYRPLARRIQSDLGRHLHQLWDDGTNAAPDNTYNRLRVLDYYVRSLLDHDRSATELGPVFDRVVDIEERINAECEKFREEGNIVDLSPDRLWCYLANVCERIDELGRRGRGGAIMMGRDGAAGHPEYQRARANVAQKCVGLRESAKQSGPAQSN